MAKQQTATVWITINGKHIPVNKNGKAIGNVGSASEKKSAENVHQATTASGNNAYLGIMPWEKRGGKQPSGIKNPAKTTNIKNNNNQQNIKSEQTLLDMEPNHNTGKWYHTANYKRFRHKQPYAFEKGSFRTIPTSDGFKVIGKNKTSGKWETQETAKRKK